MRSLKLRLSHFFLLLFLALSGHAWSDDSDGDGVDDLQDAFPNDADRQYLDLATAITGIADDRLRQCVENHTQGHETAGELTYLDCNHWGINSIVGIEVFSELEELHLSDPYFSDLSPLSNLIDLRSLNVDWGSRSISDLSPLAKLTKMTWLQMSGHRYTDLSPLQGLESLNNLSLNHSQVSDLSQMGPKPNLARIGVDNTKIRSFPDFSFAPNLERLEIRNNELTSLDGIEALSKLTSLSADNNRLTNIDAVLAIDHINTYRLSWNQVETITFTAPGRVIDHLDVSGNPLPSFQSFENVSRLNQLLIPDTKFEGLGFLRDDLRLTYLEVGGQDLTSLYGLENAIDLEQLYLRNAPNLSNFDEIGALLFLTRMDLHNLPKLQNLDFLQKLGSLNYLQIRDSKGITDFTGLSYLDDITDLRLPHLGRVDLSQIGGLYGLEHLGLNGNNISDISDLSELLFLRQLGLANNRIEDISPLNGFKQLNKLNLRDNRVKSISTVSTLTSLTWLDVQNNEVSILGGALDQFTQGNIYMSGNPLLCSEVDAYRATQNGNVSFNFDGNCYTDEDGDGVVDDFDAFPLDPAASVDTDGDGKPDDWNEGYNGSVNDLVLDDDDDNDEVPDGEDAFPQDASESSDLDNDGVGDNADAYPDDPNRQFLSIDEALSRIVDGNLRECVSGQVAGATVAGEVWAIDCNRWENAANIISLEGIQAFSELRQLSMNGQPIESLSPLSSLRKLVYLYIANGNSTYTSADPIESLTELTYLALGDGLLKDIEAIGGLTKLEELHLPYNRIENVEALSTLTQVKFLSMGGNRVSDYSPLVALKSLERLWLYNSGEVPLGDITSWVQQLNDLRELRVGCSGVTNLNLSGLAQLEFIDVQCSKLKELKLSDLPKLQQIYAGDNQISSFEVTGSPDLFSIHVNNNELKELTHVADMLAQLPNNYGWDFELGFGGNQIEDISALAGLKRIGYLDLNDNEIRDISPLKEMTNLWHLNLVNNQITRVQDIFDGYRNDAWIYLSGNPIVCDQLTYLRALSQNVQYDEACATDIDGDGVIDDYDAFPSDPAASEDTDNDGQPDEWNEGFASSDNGLTLDDDDDNDGVADIEDDFPKDYTESKDSDGDGVGDNTDAYPEDASRQFLSYDEALATIVDSEFRRCIENQTQGSSTAGDVTYIDCNGWGIQSAEGVGVFTNLEELHLDNKQFSDLTPLAGLTKLRRLNLQWGNQTISDLTPLTNLKALEYLWLDGNQIRDLTPLSGLKRLQQLNLRYNQISDLSPLTGLTGLRRLELEENQISDITPIGSLTNLSEYLDLGRNYFTDLTPLNNLKALSNLRIYESRVQGLDLSTLTGLDQLNQLTVERSGLTSVELSGLPNLHSVNFNYNQISGISVEGSPDLYHLSLHGNRLNDLSDIAAMLDSLPDNHDWLFELGFGQNQIEDVSPLGALDRVGHLDLNDNNIRDISSLSTMKNPWHMNLRNNQITKVQGVFDDYQSNMWIYLDGNPILCTEQGYLDDLSQNVEFDTGCATDSDDDGVADGYDAFPDDPAASFDNDGDGQPDGWNEGYTSSDTGLVLDNDDDNDTVSDTEDAFPNDPTESVDSDGDGVGDNSDAYPNDASRQYLPFDEALAGITDTNLKQCIEEQATGAETAGDITYLDCNNRDVQSAEGLGVFINLEDLNLDNKQFNDLSPLANLIKLRRLGIGWGNNGISDISVLANFRSLEYLHANGNQIRDLSPLAGLSELQELYVGWNQIQDLSGLKNLRSLRRLELRSNGLNDISGIEGLVSLSESLDLAENQIVDVSPLAKLSGLRDLNLSWNNISDTSTLAGMKNLNYLRVNGNNISKLQIVDLPSLHGIEAQDGQVADIEISGTPDLHNFYFWNNRFESLTNLAQQLQALPDNHGWRFNLNLGNNAITDVAPLGNVSRLGHLGLEQNSIKNVQPLASLTNLWHLNLQNNLISTLGRVFIDYRNTNIYMDGNPLLCEEEDAVRSVIDGSVSFNFSTGCGEDLDGDGVSDDLDDFPEDRAASVDSDADGLPDSWNEGYDESDSTTGLTLDSDDDNDGVDDESDAFPLDASESLDSDNDGVGDNADAYPDDATRQYLSRVEALELVTDPDLKSCIQNQMPEGESSTAGDLTRLECQWRNVRSIEGIESFINLNDLNIDGKRFSDITPLAKLKKLRRLGIGWGDNNISDLSPLTELVELEYLHANGNRITDIEPLRKLKKLREIYLSWNQISDFGALSGLVRVQHLSLDGNNMQTLPDLSGMAGLQGLSLHGNGLTNIDAISSITSLRWLNLNENKLTSLEALSGLPNLDNLEARNNLLEDFVLRDLPNLQWVSASNSRVKTLTFENLPRIYGIDFSGNQIEDYSSISELTNLQNLDLRSSGITDVSLFSDLTNLRNLNLENNEISYIGDAFANFRYTNINLTNNPLLCSEYDALIQNKDKTLSISFNSECEEDTDGDGIVDSQDRFPEDASVGLDTDGDGLPDDFNEGYTSSPSGLEIDTDDDNDGTPDNEDDLPKNPTEQKDSDGDGIGDNSDAYPQDPEKQYLEMNLAIASISDANLAQCIQEQAGNEATAGSVLILDCSYRDIQDLTGLESFIELRELYLSDKRFSDLSALAGLWKLEKLDLEWGNWDLADISPLKNLYNLNWLRVRGSQVSDLSALSNLRSLKWLDFGWSRVQDVTPLANLTRLEELYLRSNQISDVAPLANLVRMRGLDIGENQIKELSLLAALKNLNWLNLDSNGLESLVALSGLTNLTNLSANNNKLTTLDPGSLPRLSWANFQNNQITELGDLSGLIGLEGLYLDGNNIEDLGSLEDLYLLRHLGLSSNRLQTIAPLAKLTRLGELSLNRNQIRDISPLANVLGLWHLNLDDNEISSVGAIFDSYRNTNIYLRNNNLLCDEKAHIQKIASERSLYVEMDDACSEDRDGDGIADELDDFPDDLAAALDTDGDGKPDEWLEGKSASDSTTGLILDNDDDNDGVVDSEDFLPKDARDSKDSDGDGVGDNTDAYPDDASRRYLSLEDALANVEDSNLAACINDQINSLGDTAEDVSSVTDLYCHNRQIASLEGIGGFIAITQLDLSDNFELDLSPLQNLVDLRELNLRNNGRVTNPAALSGLNELQSLDLSGNSLSGAEALQDLRRLNWLNLSNNRIIDMASLSALSRLKNLSLDQNLLDDLSGIEGLEALETLSVRDNGLRSLDGLEKLTSLRELWAENNSIRSVDNLPELLKLQSLNLRDNRLLDLEGIGNLKNLTWLDLSNNSYIDSLTPLAGLEKLQDLWIRNAYIDSVASLSAMTELRHLDLERNRIESLEGLEYLQNLNWVNLPNNRIVSIEQVKDLSLQNLNLRNNRVQKFFAAVEGYPKERYNSFELYLTGNPTICADKDAVLAYRDTVQNFYVEIDENCQDDTDGDGFSDGEDAFPSDETEWLDTDGDGTGDNADEDADGDGVDDVEDAYPTDADRFRMPLVDAANFIGDRNLKGCVLAVDAAYANDVELLDCSARSIQSLEGIEKLFALKFLNLESNAITRIDAIGELKQLESVNISLNKVYSLDALVNGGSTATLRILKVARNQFADLPNMGVFEALTELDLSRNPSLDIEDLGTIPSLTKLKFSNSALSSLSGIEKLEALESISIDRNALEDISAINQLSGLNYVSAEFNDVHRLSGAFDAFAEGTIVMSENPLLCSEVDNFLDGKPSSVNWVFESACLLSEYGTDEDDDGVSAELDNCPAIANDDQSDWDSDGIGDACDDDNDNDLIANDLDNCPLVPNPDQLNTDLAADGGDLCDDDDDNDGVLDVDDAYPLDATRSSKDVGGGSQKAIIVAGGGNYRGNFLWPATQFAAQTAYNALKDQGLSDDEILVLSEDPSVSIAGSPYLNPRNIDLPADSKSLETAITDWANDPSNPTSDLMIYLVDHGGEGVFRINQRSVVKSRELDSWLDRLQNANAVDSVSIVYDACQSGSFIPDLAPPDPENQKRLLITSANAEQPALFASNGNFSFSFSFWVNFQIGGSLEQSFVGARETMSVFRGQDAQVEADWDGLGNGKNDKELVRGYNFGRGLAKAADRPLILRVTEDRVGDVALQGERSIDLEVSDIIAATKIKRVFAIVETPDQIVGADDIPVVTLTEVELFDADDDGTWETSFDGLTVKGDYRFTFFAENESGIYSSPGEEGIDNETVVHQSKGREPIIDTDTDSDGILDSIDDDDDQDGYLDSEDDFPLDAYEWLDSDGDGFGDNTDFDDDNDGKRDTEDALPFDSRDYLDSDEDGVGNSQDAFPLDASESEDADGDFIGDSVDTDVNNDGFADDPDSSDDGYESDNEYLSARLHKPAVGRSYAHILSSEGDVDFIRFPVIAGEGYTITVSPEDSTATGPDLLFNVLTNESTLLKNGKVDNELGGKDEALTFTATNTQLLRMRASGFLGSGESGYEVRIEPTDIGVTGVDLSVNLETLTPITAELIPARVSLSIQNRTSKAAADRTQVIIYGPEGAVYENFPQACNSSAGTLICDLPKMAAGEIKTVSGDVTSSKLERNVWTAVVYERADKGMGDDPQLINNAFELVTFNSKDSDGDRIPDLYELRNNLKVDTNDALADPDEDGKANIDEYKSGTNPRDVVQSTGEELVDSDADGIEDSLDAFPDDPTEQYDSDGDKIGDNSDAFPDDAKEWLDSDGDGVGNNADACPTDPKETSDSDGDTYCDGVDAFPNNGAEWVDSDGDEVGDNADVFPDDPAEWADTDKDGVGDNGDAFPNDASETADSDSDEVGDGVDNCPFDANKDQADLDGDNTGDACDLDIDGDLVSNLEDAFPYDEAESADADGDNVGDNEDLFDDDATEWADLDGDGIGDNGDNCKTEPNPGQANYDGDRRGDVCDLDDDNDGVPDELDLMPLDERIGEASLDIDGDGDTRALSDGLLTIRHLFGFEGNSLISGALGAGAAVTEPDAIKSRLGALEPALDVDLDGSAKALTDGLLIIRHLFGFEGASLTTGALGSGAQRTDPAEIKAYIDGISINSD